MTSKKTIPKTFLKWCRKHFKDDLDKVDVSAEYDRSLSVVENKTLFQEKFSIYFKEEITTTKQVAVQKDKDNLLIDNMNKFQDRFNIPISFVE